MAMDELKRLNSKKNNQRHLVIIAIIICIVLIIIFGLVKINVGRAKQDYIKIESSFDDIPEYSGILAIELNNNQPHFSEKETREIVGQNYSDLDELGRCGAAVALLDNKMLPTEERGNIGQIKPSGWHTVKYPEYISDLYLYNRCHLIAYCLSGQNDNELNLITGTRYFNVEGMLPYELEVLDCVERTEKHVLYRVTPDFREKELVARGVEIEAYSIEDNGKEICFNVYVYNVQPGIVIDYRTGESWIKNE